MTFSRGDLALVKHALEQVVEDDKHARKGHGERRPGDERLIEAQRVLLERVTAELAPVLARRLE